MPVASIAREFTPQSDDFGLRTALRNVPLLPAPANVDDLLARLDAEEVPFSSGPIAELISDARHIEPAPADDGFFAPVSLAANTNRRAPLLKRVGSGLFNVALLAGVLLIVWNALVGPDAAPPATPALDTAEATSSRSRPGPRCAGRGRRAGSGVTGGERPAARHPWCGDRAAGFATLGRIARCDRPARGRARRGHAGVGGRRGGSRGGRRGAAGFDPAAG